MAAITTKKDEIPIKRLKKLAFIYFIIMIILFGLDFYYFLYSYSILKQLLKLVKNIIIIKYCDRLSVFYVGESTLVNFNMTKIVGGIFYNIPADPNNKEGYKALIRTKIKESFIENQIAFHEILSSKLKLTKNTTKSIEEIILNTDFIMKDGRIEIISGDVFSTLMQYNGAFYNLATSPYNLEQNHTDILNFLHNSFNDYARGINLLIQFYCKELENQSKNLELIWIIGLILFFIIYSIIYFLIIYYFISSNKIKKSYMEVFYGVNENVLKLLLSNCEKLFRKLKIEKKYNEEDESEDSIDDNININFIDNKPKKLIKRKSVEITRNSQFYTDPKVKSKLSSGILNFIIFFGLLLLIAYSFFIFNSVHFISISKKAILISQYFYRAQDFHSQMIDIFIAFRQYLFDDSIIIYNMLPFDYLDKTEKESYEKLFEDVQFINDFIQKFLLYDEEVQTNLKKHYCLYNITDKFSSFEECQKKFGIILNYDFSLIASNFIEQLRVSKFYLKYILSIEIARGHLNDYDESIYLKDDTIPKVGQNYTGEYFFRFELYNNETIHAHLDLFFVNIIIPYIEINRQIIIPHLTIDNNEIYIYIISVFYLLLIFLIYATYLLSKIKIVNNHIYKTKNLLTLIPIHILSAQNNIKELLNL